MQTSSPATSSARACTGKQQPAFRLPLASFRRTHTGGIDAQSADGTYQLALYAAHGVKDCPTQFWAFETRIDERGRTWMHTGGQFAVDDFGNLVEVLPS